MEKKQVSFRLEREIIKKLKFLAVEQERSLTDLYVEAVQDLLHKYKKAKKN
jgi:predicted transcriptional regulator